MTTAIRSPSNTPIDWVARKVNDFLKDTVHSDRVHKSRRYSDQVVSGENSSAFGKQTWRIGSCGCNGRLLHKKCEVCPEHPLLCSGWLCYGFFLLTLQERVKLGQNGREGNKKNNHLANLAPEEFHTCLFSNEWMNHHIIWIGWQQGYTHVSWLHLFTGLNPAIKNSVMNIWLKIIKFNNYSSSFRKSSPV